MSALGSEGARWRESILLLKDSLTILVGDVLLASAFVSYIGCFNKRFRIDLMSKTFLPYLKGDLPQAKGGVPMSDSTDPLKASAVRFEPRRPSFLTIRETSRRQRVASLCQTAPTLSR